MLLSAISIWEKTVLHSGTLMKYLNDNLKYKTFPTLNDHPPPEKLQNGLKMNTCGNKHNYFPQMYTETGTCTHTYTVLCKIT